VYSITILTVAAYENTTRLRTCATAANFHLLARKKCILSEVHEHYIEKQKVFL